SYRSKHAPHTSSSLAKSQNSCFVFCSSFPSKAQPHKTWVRRLGTFFSANYENSLPRDYRRKGSRRRLREENFLSLALTYNGEKSKTFFAILPLHNPTNTIAIPIPFLISFNPQSNCFYEIPPQKKRRKPPRP